MSKQKYIGMTLKERLTQAGSLEAFSKALREKDEATALALLIDVEFTPAQASDTFKALLLDPNSYRNFS